MSEGMCGFFMGSEAGVSPLYEVVSEFLERFGWLADSLVYSVEFHGNLRYEASVVIGLRALDQQEPSIDKTVRLILDDVTEFRLAQQANWAAFETSSGACLAAEGDRVFLCLSPQTFAPSKTPDRLATPPRHCGVEQIRQSEFYFDFTDFIGEVLPLEAIVEDRFGDLKDGIIDVAKGGKVRRRD